MSSQLKVVVVGASGVIGRQLLPMLAASGFDVAGTTRDLSRFDRLREWGARPVQLDAYDRDGIFALLSSERPDVVIHQLTDLSEMNLEANSRLRIEGTRNLVDAARAAGIERMIAQSIAFAFAPGEGLAGEDAPLDLEGPPSSRQTAIGVASLESAVQEMPAGIVLRYGVLYGPRTLNALHGDSTAAIRRGERAATNSMTSWLHVGDAASSTLAAFSWEPGLYNVVDDEPALETEWLPLYAQIVGGPVPRMETVERPKRGASNAKARSTGWEPTFRSWRDGFPAALLEP